MTLTAWRVVVLLFRFLNGSGERPVGRNHFLSAAAFIVLFIYPVSDGSGWLLHPSNEQVAQSDVWLSPMMPDMGTSFARHVNSSRK